MKPSARLLAGLLATLLLLGMLCTAALTVSAQTVTTTASAINSARGEGQLIIYTPEYGATTNTNEWGAEAVVGADHRVTEVGGNNSAIPTGGFVLSGHDAEGGKGMKTWILQNISVGAYVYYDERTRGITVSDQPIDPSESPFYELVVTATGVNEARYTDALVIYTTAFGSNTKTNEWGYEVIVENGLITKVGGNGSDIPAGKNSFVLSGHGTMADWLATNAELGMRAEMDSRTLQVKLIFDAESLSSGLQAALDLFPEQIEQAKAEFLYMDYAKFDADYQAAQQALRDALKAYMAGGSSDSLYVAACTEVRNRIDLLRLSITESRTVQYRAVWVRPSQKNAAEVKAYVSRLHDAGINAIFLEGSYDNTVVMNVPKGSLFEHNPNFSYDVLQAYIDACHAYDMECHLWMAIYLAGYSGAGNYSRSVTAKKPEWISLNQKGSTVNEYNFVMIDPANTEARNYLLSFYEYLLYTYDLDGFQLDYIRYYNRSAEADYGYTQAAFEGFENKYHHGVTPAYDPTASYWNDWVQYRKDCITELVRGVRELINRIKPSVLLSADVVPRPEDAGVTNYQDYLTWQKQGLLDLLHPMAYGDGYEAAIRQQIQNGGDRCMVVVGLGAYLDSTNSTKMTRQAIEDTQYDAYGDAFFEATAYLANNAAPLLKQTVYRNDALTPFRNREEAIQACLTYLSGRLNDIIYPFGGVSEAEYNALQQAVSEAKASVSDARIAADQLQTLREAIAALQNANAKQVLQADLLRAERISCTAYKVTRNQLTDETLQLPVSSYTPPEVSEPDEESSQPSENSRPDESTAAPISPDSQPADDASTTSWVLWLLLGIGGVAVIAIVLVVCIRRKAA